LSSPDRRRSKHELPAPPPDAPGLTGADAVELSEWARRERTICPLTDCPELDRFIEDNYAGTMDLMRALGAGPADAGEAVENWVTVLTWHWTRLDHPARISDPLALIFHLRLRWQEDRIRVTYQGRHTTPDGPPADLAADIWLEQYLISLDPQEQSLIAQVLQPWPLVELAEALQMPSTNLALHLARASAAEAAEPLLISEEGAP
jgi:hypothetical protein